MFFVPTKVPFAASRTFTEVVVATESPALYVVEGAGVLTVTVTDLVAEPPEPVQTRVYVEVEVGVTASELLTALVPLHAPLALQDVALVEDQVRVEEDPELILEGVAVMDTVGWGVGGGVGVVFSKKFS